MPARQIIDVVFRVDTDTVQQHYPQPSKNPKKPTAINPEEAYFVAAPASPVQDVLSASVLTLKAQRGGLLRWHPSGNVSNGCYVIIYNIKSAQSADSALPLISPFRLQTIPSEIPIPDADDPLHYSATEQISSYAQNQVDRNGQSSYSMYFYLVAMQGSQLETIGYYSWDFSLNILAV